VGSPEVFWVIIEVAGCVTLPWGGFTTGPDKFCALLAGAGLVDDALAELEGDGRCNNNFDNCEPNSER
jgi:hypothetical protein